MYFEKFIKLFIEFTVIVIVTVISFKFISAFCEKIKNKIISKNNDNTIASFMPLIDKVLKITLIFIIIATILQTHGYSITTLVAGFGITGLAVGFGAQNTISNLFGSFALLADKVFKIGDFIILNQDIQGKPVSGFVEEINLRSTKIRCDDGSLLIIPNNTVANGIVKNTSQKVK